jgi:carbamoyltransferase
VAVAEERLSRRKHDAGFPERAIPAVLADAGLEPSDLGAAVFHEKPVRKLERIAAVSLAGFPHALPAFSLVVPDWLRRKLWVRFDLERALGREVPILMGAHHRSHAAAAFLLSPFEEAAILTVDGVGEWATASWGVGRGHRFELREETRFPHSLGLLYSAVTSLLGYPINEGEGTIMGLAPYGEPRFRSVLERVAPLDPDGSIRLDPRVFPFSRGRARMFGRRLERLLAPRRPREAPLEDVHRDVAASLQAHVEEALLRMVRHVHDATGLPRLCLSGGVALNSVANGRIAREGPFEEVWVCPAPGDDGAAAGRPPMPSPVSTGGGSRLSSARSWGPGRRRSPAPWTSDPAGPDSVARR